MANTYSEYGSGQRFIFSSTGPIYIKQLHCSVNEFDVHGSVHLGNIMFKFQLDVPVMCILYSTFFS
jgi:hypothetical protein